MSSQIDLANRALLQVGARIQISSFTEGSTEANACALLWQPTFEQLGRVAQWGCLRKQVTLTLLQAGAGTPENVDGTTLPLPPNPWLYAYAYPSDCLKAWWIVPSFPANTGDSTPQTTISNGAGTWLPNNGQIVYQIATSTDANGSPIRVILTNQEQAQLVYAQNQPNPQQWDSLFEQAFVGALGAYLVPALSLSIPVMQVSIKTAEAAIAQARAQDGNEGVTVMDHLPDWMRARAGGQGYGLNGYTNFTTWGGFENMVWPGDFYNIS